MFFAWHCEFNRYHYVLLHTLVDLISNFIKEQAYGVIFDIKIDKFRLLLLETNHHHIGPQVCRIIASKGYIIH